MSTAQIILAAAAVVIVAAVLVIRVKRISPLGWGWYGKIQTMDGFAVAGYDPVAYFDGKSLRGDPAVSLEWNGVRWLFASVENRARFQADPARFEPQFGGFCSYASSKGFTAKIDPTAFRVEDGKLFLFNDASMRDRWIAELGDGVIDRGRKNWKSRP